MNFREILRRGEGPAVEFKRSTGQLKEGLQTLCAFLNGSGGTLLFGVGADGRPGGQQVSDRTLRDLAQALDGFDPPVNPPVERRPVGKGLEVLVLTVRGGTDSAPYTFEGRPYERVQSSTRRMSKERYEELLLERVHVRRRWENQPAEGITIRDIDRDEVFRILGIARSLGRLTGPVGRSLPDALNRMGLRKGGRILRAAVVLFGRTFLPDYPQCELRMARFRGTDKTEFLDQRQVRGPAFRLLEEAELFCQRHFPMPAKIVPGQMRRVEKPLIPPDAMREILVNALIHRDYSVEGGAVSLALFDDRVEVWSAGGFPKGITADALSRSHLSVQRNPLIADLFNRTGLIEKWGRGTNRVIAMCREAGIRPPEFEEVTGAAVVTFRVPVKVESKVESGSGQDPVGTQSGPSRDQVVILRLCREEKTLIELMKAAGRKNRTKFRIGFIRPLLSAGWIRMTVPGKPNSRLQKYRLTPAGKEALR